MTTASELRTELLSLKKRRDELLVSINRSKRTFHALPVIMPSYQSRMDLYPPEKGYEDEMRTVEKRIYEVRGLLSKMFTVSETERAYKKGRADALGTAYVPEEPENPLEKGKAHLEKVYAELEQQWKDTTKAINAEEAELRKQLNALENKRTEASRVFKDNMKYQKEKVILEFGYYDEPSDSYYGPGLFGSFRSL